MLKGFNSRPDIHQINYEQVLQEHLFRIVELSDFDKFSFHSPSMRRRNSDDSVVILTIILVSMLLLLAREYFILIRIRRF